MDFQRMIRSRQFWVAVFVATAGLFFGTAWPGWKKDTVFASGTFLQLAKDSLKSRVVLFLIPVTALIPWGEEYLKEKQGNFLRSLIIRKGKRFYCMDRSVMTALSGILVWIIASFLQTLFFFLLFFWKEEVFSLSKELVTEYVTLLARVCLVTSGMASLGGACGAWSNSVYLGMGLPFVTYFALMILRERYLENLYCVDPGEWIRGEAFWGSGQRGLWIFLILFWMLLLLLHGAALEKGLEEL